METTDHQIDEARDRLVAHIEELGRRFHDIKEKLDLRAQIVAHPRIAVGIALAAGALLALPRHRKVAEAEAKRSIGGAAAAMLGSLALGLIKNVALHQLSGSAKAWWDEHDLREGAASREDDMEAFLEH